MRKYPRFAAVAHKVLAVPANPAKAGLIARNRLTGDAVTLLVWLREAWKPIEKFVATQKEKKVFK